MERYYVLKSPGLTSGPFPLSSLETLYRKGLIDASMLICKEGEQDWIPCSSVMASSFSPNSYSAQRTVRENKKGSILPSVLIFLCTLSVGGGVIMGLVSFIAGFIGLGLGYIFGGAVGGVLWYTLFVLITKK